MNFSSSIRKTLRQWYVHNHRELPWRATKNPYSIWISEVILQQTRVEQGMEYYHRFVERFPDVASLAVAEEDEVLKLWQGLGYYSRARNLHKAARQVMEMHGGKFPEDPEAIRGLKGIGPYTAAAIASIAFGTPVAAVDGNVARVIARLFAVEEAVNKSPGAGTVDALATELLDRQDPALHNQAMMEFGALQCVPVNPDCARCCLRQHCKALATGKVGELPRKHRSLQRKKRYFHYLIVSSGNEVAVEQRKGRDIWQGLYQFPLIEKDSDTMLSEGDLDSMGLSMSALKQINQASKHVLSHQDIFALFYHVQPREQPSGLHFVADNQLSELALPRLIDRYLEQYDLKTGEKS